MEMFLKVNVQPFASSFSGLTRAYSNHLCRYSPMTISIRNDGVQNERMDPSVPRDIYEPDKVRVITSAYPPKTMASHLRPPIIC